MNYLALLLGLLGAGLIYLAHPNQGWRACPLPRRWALLGTLLLLAAIWPWCRSLGTAAGVAASTLTPILGWTLAPYLAWPRAQPPIRPRPQA